MSDTSGRRTVAVMQPYFFPYAGYFRLLAQADEFVIFDCVQFPARGRVHRTEVPGPRGDLEWLTLPLAPRPRSTRIADLQFAAGARDTLDQRLARLAWVESGDGPGAPLVRAFLCRDLDDVVRYIEDGLRLVAELLGLHTPISRSSELALDPAIVGQDRVMAVAEARGAERYLNAPGGRHLYDADRFAARGMELAFLSDYAGPYRHLLPALVSEDPARIRDDIVGTTTSA